MFFFVEILYFVNFKSLFVILKCFYKEVIYKIFFLEFEIIVIFVLCFSKSLMIFRCLYL